MTKTAILTLAIYCGVEFLSGFTLALMTAMAATTNGEMPNWLSITFAVLTGISATTKTLMPVLKAMLVDFGLKMNGDASPVVKAAAKIA